MFRHPPRPLLLLAALVACVGCGDRRSDGPATDSAEPIDTSPCDGQIGTVYLDADGDGFGIEDGEVEGCVPAVEGFAERAGDCEDADPLINPGQIENCATEWDDNCDGLTNRQFEELGEWGPDGCTYYYLDNDADGSGVYGEDECTCAPEAPYTALMEGDCDDGDANIFRDGGGCLTFDEELWTARVNGHYESQGLGFNSSSTTYLIADLTSDGVMDLLVGESSLKTSDGSYIGAIYLIPGPVEGEVSLGDKEVFRLQGDTALNIYLLGQLTLTMDLNNDGVSDMVFGGAEDDSTLWILDGARWRRDGFDALLTKLQATNREHTALGSSGAVSSDLDGDGVAELILGDWSDGETNSGEGAVYIVTNPPAGHHDINDVSTAKLKGEAKSDYAGRCVADAGDTDGDGLGDVLIGAINAYSGGAAYLVRGPVEGDLSLADADAIFVSETGGANGGCGLAGGGDANGDGLDDLLIGAYTAYGESGAAYLVLGGGHAEGRSLMNESAEAMFVGHEVVEYGAFWTGKGVAFVEGADGTDALAIGSGVAKFFELSAGAVTLVVNPEPGVHLIGSVGLTLNGTEAPGALGWSLTAAPDVDGDGWGELVLAAPKTDTDGVRDTGSLFLVPGGLLSGL